MRIQYRWVMLLFTILFLQACTMPRLGVESVRYSNTPRQPTPAGQYIPIYSSLDDVPFNFVVIGKVIAAPVSAAAQLENEFDYDPLENDPLGLLRRRAREMGGAGLVGIKRGAELDSRYEWKAMVVGRSIPSR